MYLEPKWGPIFLKQMEGPHPKKGGLLGSRYTPAQFSPGLPVCSHVSFFSQLLNERCAFPGSSFGADAPRESQAKRYYRGGHSPGKGQMG